MEHHAINVRQVISYYQNLYQLNITVQTHVQNIITNLQPIACLVYLPVYNALMFLFASTVFQGFINNQTQLAIHAIQHADTAITLQSKDVSLVLMVIIRIIH